MRIDFKNMLLIAMVLFSTKAFAEEVPDISAGDGTVEVDYASEIDVPYKYRRGTWSGYFALGVDQIFPEKYQSVLTGDDYKDVFGDARIKIAQGTFGIKFNMPFAAIGADLTYGYGSIARSTTGIRRELVLTKKAASVGLYLDRFSDEAYLIPYGKAQLFSFDYKEIMETGDLQKTDTTSFAAGTQAGVLIQLNWLDEASAREAYNSSRVKNSYLDLFVSQYGSTTNGGKEDLQSGVNYGAAVSVDF